MKVTMKDNEIRGIVLRAYYDRRRDGEFQWYENDLKNLPKIDRVDLFRACDQLAEHGLINWNPIRLRSGTITGAGKITALGVDVIEGHSHPPDSITLDQSISIHGSSNVQVGSHNVQDISIQIEKLVSAIDHSSASDEEKAEAKSRLKKFLEHPLVASIAGGLASTIR
jgi:RIP homotypic interaction motif